MEANVGVWYSGTPEQVSKRGGLPLSQEGLETIHELLSDIRDQFFLE